MSNYQAPNASKERRVRVLYNYIRALQGITYQEWIMLQTAIGREFERQKGEFERNLKLANIDGVKEIIRIQFGQTSD